MTVNGDSINANHVGLTEIWIVLMSRAGLMMNATVRSQLLRSVMPRKWPIRLMGRLLPVRFRTPDIGKPTFGRNNGRARSRQQSRRSSH